MYPTEKKQPKRCIYPLRWDAHATLTLQSSLHSSLFCFLFTSRYQDAMVVTHLKKSPCDLLTRFGALFEEFCPPHLRGHYKLSCATRRGRNQGLFPRNCGKANFCAKVFSINQFSILCALTAPLITAGLY